MTQSANNTLIMKAPAYTLSPNFVSVFFEGKSNTVYSSDSRFEKIKECLKNQDWKALSDALHPMEKVFKYSFGKIKVDEGMVLYNNVPVNNSVVSRILEFVKNGFPYQPLVKFLDNLMQNPNKDSVEQLYKYIELYKLPITDDGHFIALKSVRNDFKDHFTGTIDNSPGQKPFMRREDCESSVDKACGRGLHCGAQEYVKTYNGRTILVKVNPKDVVSCPKDHSYMKMRTCAYEVLSEVEDSSRETKDFETNYAPENSYAKKITSPKRDSKGRFIKATVKKKLIGKGLKKAKVVKKVLPARLNKVDTKPKRSKTGQFISNRKNQASQKKEDRFATSLLD